MEKYLFIFFLAFFSLFSLGVKGKDHRGKLGVGLSNQLINNLPAVSFKLQQGENSAYGGVLAINTADPGGGYGAGLKFYGFLFDEPQLNFYYSVLGAIIAENSYSAEDQTGFQFDLTLGSEFVFKGLESLGFSFEFGVSFNKISEFRIETVGNGVFTAGIHFYL